MHTIKKLTPILALILLSACQTTPEQTTTSKSQNTEAPKEILDVSDHPYMQQIKSSMTNGNWMFTFTNDGIRETDPNIKQKNIVVQLRGQSQPYRLRDIFPSNCHELSYKKFIENSFTTWIDILSCPQYQDSGQSMFVITKAIQGSEYFYGVTRYLQLPIYDPSLNTLETIPLPKTERDMMQQFIKDTRITIEE